MITYPYRVLEDVLVRVDGLLFPTDFVILDMPEDSKTPLLLGRPFMVTGKALIDVAHGDLILRFNEEIFSSMVWRAEAPKVKSSVLLGKHGGRKIENTSWKKW